jgi:hypothetical protein
MVHLLIPNELFTKPNLMGIALEKRKREATPSLFRK